MTTSGLRPVASVLEPGPLTTVQDSGRFGYRRFGVPASGAMDLGSLSVANGHLGNKPGSPALEVFHGPIVLGALEDIVVGHSGNSAIALVGGKMVNDNPLRVRKGSSFRLEPGENSTIVYVAFAGGLVVDVVMGSASTYTRARFGGIGGRALQKGDLLYAAGGVVEPATRRTVTTVDAPERHRVIRGPHADLFPPESLDGFFKAEYRISFDSDRMGYRLGGPILKGFGEWGRVLTFPVFPGMVQVTPDGLPIVLMADCQTTGGYPVIAMVLPPDLCALAQKPPGAAVAFKQVTNEESQNVIESFSLTTGLGPKARR
jgi:antagonist of KipI